MAVQNGTGRHWSWSGRCNTLLSQERPAAPSNRKEAVIHLARAALHDADCCIHGGFLRDWLVNGQEPNDIDCLTLDAETSAHKISQIVYKFGIRKGPKRSRDAAVTYAFEWKRPGMKDEVIDVEFSEFEHFSPPGVDTDVGNLLLNKHGLTRKVLGNGLVPIETALKHIEEKSFVYFYEPNPDKKPELLRLKKYLERGWTCKTQIPLEARNKLAEGLDKSRLPNEFKGCAEFNKEWWKMDAKKLSVEKALVAKPEVEVTLSEAASSEPGGGMKEQRPMKHNDMQLHEMLRLARSCLKYDALPGELSMRGFFDKFDADLAAKSSKQLSTDESSEKQMSQEAQASNASPPLAAKATVDSTMKNLAALRKILHNVSFQQIVEQSANEIDASVSTQASLKLDNGKKVVIQDDKLALKVQNDDGSKFRIDQVGEQFKLPDLPGAEDTKFTAVKQDGKTYLKNADAQFVCIDAGKIKAITERRNTFYGDELQVEKHGSTLSDDDPTDRRTAKSQTAQLEQIAKEAAKALEACAAELSQEVVKKMQLENDEKTVEAELKKGQHQLRLAKDMVKRQDVEIENLQSNIQALKVAAANSTQSAPAAIGAPYPPPPGSGKPKAGRPRPPPGVQSPNQGEGASSEPSVAGLLAAELIGDAGNTSELVGRPTSQRRPNPPPPNLASSIVLPPKIYKPLQESVLTRPRDSAWKLFIP